MLGAVFNRFYLGAVALPTLVLAMSMPVAAEPVARNGTAAGAVIARKVGEEVRFINVSDWRTVDLKQDLLTGDILRTNETGQLAILFSDRTQVRLGRNSSLVVKQITASTDADTVLQLQSGTIWARAERGGPGVKVETPAAAAAIRGTDWTMTVNGSQTSLTVLEGLVQFSNPQGSVEVKQGEGAAATLGQAPRKIVIVNSDDRQQMLFYMPAREAFERMEPSGQPAAAMRRDIDRTMAIPPGRRSTEDWVALAERQLTLDGRAKSKQTLSALRGRHLSPGQQARVTLIEAILAAGETRYADAAKLFAKAELGLDSKRRGIATYGGYYARSLADPNWVEPLPNKVTSAKDAFLRAYALGITKDIKSAVEALAQAEKQFPNTPELPAYRAWMASLLNDRQQAREAIEKAISADPEEPVALEARSHYRMWAEGDIKGALADAEASARIAPGVSSAWNQIGLVQNERGANREAEAAFRKAIELKPEDPLGYANLAIFYLDQNRVEDAKREIDRSLERDPTASFALAARGRYYIQTGETDRAINDILAGTVSDPGDAAMQLLLSAAHYQKGDRIAAEQAADNADRLDKNLPEIPSLRAAVAIDSYDSEGAIRNAQEYVRRARAQGGEYSSLGANQEAGSTLNSAFRFQGLNSWAEYYSDAVFDPFAGAAYVDQAIRGSANPFANSYFYGSDAINNHTNGQAFSSLLQGLLLEPHLISSPSLGQSYFSRPFLETSLGTGVTAAGGRYGTTAEASIDGYTHLPFPISFSGSLEWLQAPDSRDLSFVNALSDLDNELRVLSGNAYLTASPTPYDRFVAYFARSRTDFGFDFDTVRDAGPLFGVPFPVPVLTNVDQSQLNRVTSAGIGWSHTVEYHNVINAALLFSGTEGRSWAKSTMDLGPIGPFVVDYNYQEYEQKTYVAAVNHTVETGDFTWRYGLEGGWIDTYNLVSGYDFLATPPVFPTTASSSTRVGLGRAYVDLLHEITPDLKAEYALFGTILSGDGTDVQRLDPRIGISWSPLDGQLLRAGYMRSSVDTTTPTLSPIGIVGLQANDISTGNDGYSDTLALRWDAQWTPDFFTALEYQHQDVHDLELSIPLAATPVSISEGVIDRASLSANLLLGYGFGLSSTVAYTHSQNEDPTEPTFNRSLPYIPEWAGQVALTWVNQANVKTTLAANYVGDRLGRGGDRLDDYWTLDASLAWEPFDKRFEIELNAYNLLDEDIQLETLTPGWGRSFKGTLKVRF